MPIDEQWAEIREVSAHCSCLTFYFFLRACTTPKTMKATTAIPNRSQRGTPSSPL